MCKGLTREFSAAFLDEGLQASDISRIGNRKCGSTHEWAPIILVPLFDSVILLLNNGGLNKTWW